MNELRTIMTVVVGVCALAVAGSVSPTVDHLANLGFGVLFGLLGLRVAGHVTREVWRELRFRADMRALDRRDAARHLPPSASSRAGSFR